MFGSMINDHADEDCDDDDDHNYDRTSWYPVHGIQDTIVVYDKGISKARGFIQWIDVQDQEFEL